MRNFLTFILILSSIYNTGYSQFFEEKLDTMFSTLHARGQYNGNVLVMMAGQKIHMGSYGYADRETKKELSEASLFNLGTGSMAYTAVAILQLIETGKISPEDQVNIYLREFPYSQITIDQLLYHTSGLPQHKEFYKNSDPPVVINNKILLQEFYSQKPDLQFKPGLKIEFNELGYILLAEIIEAVSHVSYTAYLEKHIFSPASLENTFVLDIHESLINKNTAFGYLYHPGYNKYLQCSEIPDYSFLYPESGLRGNSNIYTTTKDFYKFCQAILERKILNNLSVEKLFKISIPDYNTSLVPGYKLIDENKKILFIDSALPGYRILARWDFSKNILIVMFSNDYYKYLSYHTPILSAIDTLITEEKFYIPKLDAGTELTAVINLYNNSELKKFLEKINENPEVYQIDWNTINQLINRLEKNGYEKQSKNLKKSIEKELKKNHK